jgi:hypothetical protein
MTGDQYDRKSNTEANEPVLEIKSACPRQPHVKYDTSRGIGPGSVDELARRSVGPSLYSDRAKQTVKGSPQRFIVIDNMNNRPVVRFLYH